MRTQMLFVISMEVERTCILQVFVDQRSDITFGDSIEELIPSGPLHAVGWKLVWVSVDSCKRVSTCANLGDLWNVYMRWQTTREGLQLKKPIDERMLGTICMRSAIGVSRGPARAPGISPRARSRQHGNNAKASDPHANFIK